MTTTLPGPDDAAPVRRSRYATSDPDEGTEFLRARYTHFEPTYSAAGPFVLDVASEAFATARGPLQLDRLRHSSTMRVEAEPLAQLVVTTVQSGRAEFTSRGCRAGALALMPTWDGYTADWDGSDLLVSSLELDTVARVGAELSGLAPVSVAFREMAPVSRDRARGLAALLAHLRRDLLPHEQLLASPLVRAETVRHLATTMLLTFPNTALDVLTDPLAPAPGGAQPATVRRAVAFVDEHAGEPIGLTEIAAAAGVGVRGLQHAFRRHRDDTPLGYLREVRMERAHRDLQACHPSRGDTVAAVAVRWGFTHRGRFSTAYRLVYGRSPHQTLKD